MTESLKGVFMPKESSGFINWMVQQRCDLVKLDHASENLLLRKQMLLWAVFGMNNNKKKSESKHLQSSLTSSWFLDGRGCDCFDSCIHSHNLHSPSRDQRNNSVPFQSLCYMPWCSGVFTAVSHMRGRWCKKVQELFQSFNLKPFQIDPLLFWVIDTSIIKM